MKKGSKKSNRKFIGTIVLCCMIALIFFGIGGLGVYLYFYNDITSSKICLEKFDALENDTEKYDEVEKNIKVKNCFNVSAYEILEKIYQEDQTGQYRYVVAKQFQSDPVLLKISKDFYEKLEIGKNYELQITYLDTGDYAHFLEANYNIINIQLSDKVGLDQVETLNCK